MATQPISIRLEDRVRAVLEQDAKERGVGIATYLRDLATDRAKTVRKAQIRAESKRVGEYVRTHPDAQEFYDDWGTPTAEF